MNARSSLLAGTALGAALIGAPSLAFVAYSAGYQAGTEAPSMRPAVAAPVGERWGMCAIPNISDLCGTDPNPLPMPTAPLRPVATTGLCAIPNISPHCPVR